MAESGAAGGTESSSEHVRESPIPGETNEATIEAINVETTDASATTSSPSPPSAEEENDKSHPFMHSTTSYQNSKEKQLTQQEWNALKALKWQHGKDLTAYIQDYALERGKRALVATSGGSYKKFVCSSDTACPWLINAVCSRTKKRRTSLDNGEGGASDSTDESKHRYWYVTSGCIVHDPNCTSVAKPTARQLKKSLLLQAAVKDNVRVSSAVLVEQLKQKEHLVCSKSMVYKAKTDLLDALAEKQVRDGSGQHGAHSQVVASVQCLPSYFAQMSALNAHTMSLIERDEHGCFLRAVLAMDPTGVWNDQCVLGIDSCEMQNRHYNGTQLVLIGRDGNFQPIVHAIALVPEESPEHCTWFLDKMITHGFPLRRFPIFTNGRWGFTASCSTLQIPHTMHCTQHLIDDMKQNQAITLRPDQVALIWKAQQAVTESEYVATIAHLGQLNFAAAHYVKSLDPKRWALFPYLTMRKLYGWQTTMFVAVDQGQSIGLSPTTQLPYECFKSLSLVLMNAAFQRHERAMQWEREQRVVTPEAERLMQEELKLVPLYNVVMSTTEVAFVWNANEPQICQRRVDLQFKTCTCAFRLQRGIPCRHILAALQKLNALNQSLDFFDECYLVRNYISSFKGRYLELPLDETIQRDPTLRPPRLVQKQTNNNIDVSAEGDLLRRPSPKKPRVRRRTRVEQRKRGMYKCHKCHRADGHNKGTCPYQQESVQF